MQQELNSKIWQNNRLLPEVRDRLLVIANKFLEGLDVGQQPKDVLFTGSLASYNWTAKSDLDLHVVLDFSTIDGGGKLVKDYMLAKKGLWNDRHHVVIKGFPVELYAQDAQEPHYALGIYSVLNDRWVKEPVQSDEDVVDHATVDKKVEQLQHDIEQAVVDQDLPKLEMLSEKLRHQRSEGLAEGGEFSTGNQVFKALRRSGMLDKLAQAKLEITDSQLSLSTKEQPMVKKSDKGDAEMMADKFEHRGDACDYLVELMGAESVLKQLVMALGDDVAFDNFGYIARMNDIDLSELPAVRGAGDEETEVMGAIASIGVQAVAPGFTGVAVYVDGQRLSIGDPNYVKMTDDVASTEADLQAAYPGATVTVGKDHGANNVIIEVTTKTEEQQVMAAIAGIGENHKVKASGLKRLADAMTSLTYLLGPDTVLEQLLAEMAEDQAKSYLDHIAEANGIDLEEVEEEAGVMAAIGSIGKIGSDFRNYCRGLTDQQVLNVVEKERAGAQSDPDRESDYEDAMAEAHSRGLTASKNTEESEVMAAIAGIGVQAAPRKKKPAVPKTKAKPAPAPAPAVAAPAAPAFDDEQVKAELAAVLGTTADDVTIDREDSDTKFVTAGGTEYEVMESEDAAEARAVAQVKEDLENEPSMFSPEWLQGHLEIYDTDRRIIAGEEADSLYDDRDEEEIKEEYEREIAGGEYAPEKLVEGDIDAMREALKDKKSDEVGEELKDPVKYFVTDNGMYSMEDLMKAPFIRIDVDAAAADAVSVDGWPHFISHYDGNYETTKAGFVYWRA